MMAIINNYKITIKKIINKHDDNDDKNVHYIMLYNLYEMQQSL